MVIHPASKAGDVLRLPEARLAEAVGLAGAIDIDFHPDGRFLGFA